MPPSRRGTGYVNLQQYLGLNQSGADALGQGLGQDLARQGEQAISSINGAAAAARNAANAGVTAPGGQYAGPGSFDTGALSTQVAEAQRTASAAQDQTGRAELLAKKYGPNTWGGGQLDSALAGAGRGAGAVSEAATGVRGLAQYLGGVSGQTNAYISKAQGSTKAPPTTPVTGKPLPPPHDKFGDPRKEDDLDKYARGGRP